MSENNKPMTEKEIVEKYTGANGNFHYFHGAIEDVIRDARLNMIPAENAIVVPELDWTKAPRSADSACIIFGKIQEGWEDITERYDPLWFVGPIVKPQPAWTPKDLEPVIFAKPEDDTTLLGIFYKGEILFGYLRHSFRGMRCRPFRESAIGLPWEKI